MNVYFTKKQSSNKEETADVETIKRNTTSPPRSCPTHHRQHTSQSRRNPLNQPNSKRTKTPTRRIRKWTVWTIDSVARNFGTDLATGTDSSSDDEMQQDIVPSPVGVKPEPSAMSVNAELKQSSPKINSPSLPMNSTKSPSVLMTSPKVSFTFG